MLAKKNNIMFGGDRYVNNTLEPISQNTLKPISTYCLKPISQNANIKSKEVLECSSDECKSTCAIILEYKEVIKDGDNILEVTVNNSDYKGDIEIDCPSSSVNSKGGSYRRKTKKGGVGSVSKFFKKIKILFKSTNTIVPINNAIENMCENFLKNIQNEHNFIELNAKITAIDDTEEVNEHEIFTNRVEESKNIAEKLLVQIDKNKFPFKDSSIKDSLTKIKNLNKNNVSSADIINIMNYTKYLDSNFAIIYYQNNKKLNLDFLIALNSQKHLLNTDSFNSIEKNFSKLFGQVIQKIIMEYILIEKYFKTSSVNNYFITQILQDNNVNFSGRVNINEKYKSTLKNLIDKLTLKNTNTDIINNVKNFLITIVNKTTTDESHTASYSLDNFIKSDFSNKMDEIEIYYFLHINKMLFIYDSEYSKESLNKETEYVIQYYSEDLLRETTITLSDLSWYLYYINYEKDIPTEDVAPNLGDGTPNTQVLQRRNYVNIVTLTKSQIYILFKYFPNTSNNSIVYFNFLKIIMKFENILARKPANFKISNIQDKAEKFRDNLFNHVMYPDYYELDNVFHDLTDLDSTDKEQLKDLIRDIANKPVLRNSSQASFSGSQQGGQRKYLPELYKCKDNRYRKVFLIKGKGNTKFVVSKNKVVKASSIPCVKKVNK